MTFTLYVLKKSIEWSAMTEQSILAYGIGQKSSPPSGFTKSIDEMRNFIFYRNF